MMWKGRAPLFVLPAVMTLALIVPAVAQTPKDVAKKSFASVVLITMEDANKQPLSLGSGFFVSEGVIATNLHVIEGATFGHVKLIGSKQPGAINGTVGIDDSHDLALLAVDIKTAPSLSFADDDAAAVGDTVFAVGNPQGLEGTFSQGIVSGIRQLKDDRLLQITAPISPGSSGGPVLNEQGAVLGVAVATLRGGQNLNFAVPASFVRALLRTRTNVEPLKPGRKRQQDSVLADLGGSVIEGVKVSAFEWENEYEFQDADFTVSVKNELQTPIHQVSILVVFYGKSGEPLDATWLRTGLGYVIPPGLARRAKGNVEKSVHRLTTWTRNRDDRNKLARTPDAKVEYRVLGFNFAE